MKEFLRFIKYPDFITALLIGIYPVFGLTIFGWDSSELIIYFVLETIVISLFTFLKLLINTKVKEEVELGAKKSNADLSNYNTTKFYIITNITTALLHLLFQTLFLGMLITVFINLVIYGGTLTFDTFLSQKSQIYSLLIIYGVDFVINYLILKGYKTLTPRKINNQGIGRSAILFLSFWLVAVIFTAFGNPTILAFMLILVRIFVVVGSNLLIALFRYLKFKYPNLKIESDLE